MKKNIFSLFVFVLLVTNINDFYAQQVPKKFMLLEIGTGTWCTYCPGAAMGADDLVTHGHKVAVIENHNGDSFANTGSNARNSYYGINSFPTAVFDGGEKLIGGSHSDSLYGAYLPLYEEAMNELSDFTVALSFVRDGQDFDVTIDLEEVGDYAGENLVVHLVLTESEISYNWQGQTHLNFVNRAMYPNQNGTTYVGGTDTMNISFTANASWDLENAELVAFIQDNDTKSILQVDRVFLKIPPEVENSLVIFEASEIPDVCFGNVSPSFLIKNVGANAITSMDIDYSINAGATTGTYNWEGNIGFNEYANVTMEHLGFELLENNDIEYTVSSVNGVVDPDESDNHGVVDFNESPETSSTVINLELHTDNYGSECTWKIMDYTGNVLESGGPYGNNQTINETFTLPGADCYYFQLIDQYGDGGGMVKLTDESDQVLYYTTGSYGAGYTQAFKTPNAGLSLAENVFVSTSIFPNPAKDVLYINHANGMRLRITDLLGRVLLTKDVKETNAEIDVRTVKKGVYLIQLSKGLSSYTEKIIITK